MTHRSPKLVNPDQVSQTISRHTVPGGTRNDCSSDPVRTPMLVQRWGQRSCPGWNVRSKTRRPLVARIAAQGTNDFEREIWRQRLARSGASCARAAGRAALESKSWPVAPCIALYGRARGREERRAKVVPDRGGNRWDHHHFSGDLLGNCEVRWRLAVKGPEVAVKEPVPVSANCS